jgi:hypothetical protein
MAGVEVLSFASVSLHPAKKRESPAGAKSRQQQKKTKERRKGWRKTSSRPGR